MLGILDPEFGATVERTFLSDVQRAQEIRPEEWQRRGIRERALERFFIMFEEQI